MVPHGFLASTFGYNTSVLLIVVLYLEDRVHPTDESRVSLELGLDCRYLQV
jgi:hypothetical protein